MIHTYKGRPLTSLTHDELIEAARWAWNELANIKKVQGQNLEMEEDFCKTREAIKSRR